MKKHSLLVIALIIAMHGFISCGGGGGSSAPALSSTKAITAFSFTNPAATGVIDETAKTIAVTVPYGTNVNVLIAKFTTTGTMVTVGSTVQVSESTANDFTNPVLYVVIAADGTTASYTVTVSMAPSTAKAITAFSFASPPAAGTVYENEKTITISVPIGTDVTALTAEFTTTGSLVTVGTTTQLSGATQNDFTNPVDYTVTAEEGTTETYTVTVIAAAIRLPKTGQTKCFDEAGTAIACTNTGEDGELQKGLGWPSPRFTTNSDTTITDNLTGLIWDAIGNPMLTIYTSFDTDGYNEGAVTWQHALDFIAQLNTDDYLGHNDWRLPNRNELKSIANYGEKNGKAWLNTQGFSIADGGSYWTSTSSEYNPKMAHYVVLLGGAGSVKLDYKTTYSSGGFTFYPVNYVWAVRGGRGAVAWAEQPQTGQTLCYDENGAQRACTGTGEDGELKVGVSWPNPRFTNANNTSPISGDVVVDRLTGLMWSKDGNTPGPAACNPGAAKNWQGALDYVACLNANNYLDYSDWRLPNANELGSLVNAGQSNIASWVNTQGFTNAQSYYYWSSTPSSYKSYGFGPEAFYLHMNTGTLSAATRLENVFNVWPVRAGQ